MAYSNSYSPATPPQNPNVGQGYSTSQDRGPGTPVVGGMGGDPGQGYYQQQGYPQQIPTNPMSAQYGQMQGMLDLYGPQMALSNALGQQQITGLEGANYWNDQSLMNQMNSTNQGAMYQMAGLGLQGQTNDIQQAALSRQLGNLPAQYGLQTQGFGLQEAGAQQAAQTQRRGLDSQATASGAYTSIGANQGRGDITSSLQRQMQQIGLQRQGAAMNYMEQTAQMQDAQKELGIQSKQLGLNENEVRSRLDNALNQLGIQGQVNADQLLAETSKIKQGMVSPLSGLISMIGQQTNLPLLTGGGQ